jgi:hypothetical protein
LAQDDEVHVQQGEFDEERACLDDRLQFWMSREK